jgi:hypothetical protein
VRPESASEKTVLLLHPSFQLVTPPLPSGSSPRRQETSLIDEEKIRRFVQLHRRILEEIGLKESLLLNINIFRSPTAARIFTFLLSNDESTTPDMADKLGIALYGKHVYHIIRRLRELGVIVRSGHVRRVPAERGGRKASIWRTIA